MYFIWCQDGIYRSNILGNNFYCCVFDCVLSYTMFQEDVIMATFIIDSREPKTIKEVLTQCFEEEGIITDIQELPEGDFKYNNIIIERKEINDFVSSIKDKRYKTQRRKLLQRQNEGYHVYFLIHGNPKDLAEENYLPKKAIAGAIASLNEHGIHTLQCSRYDLEMIFQLIYGVIRKYNEDKKIETVFIEPDNTSWTAKALMCISGVGKETANNIVAKLPHLKLFYNSNKINLRNTLLECEGVGTRTVDKILKEVLNDD